MQWTNQPRCLWISLGNMSSRGLAETNQLRKNLEDQMDRLVQQLADLEEVK